jgi:elongation factor Ts
VFVRTLAGIAVNGDADVDNLGKADYPGTGRSVAEELTELVGRIGENLVLRRGARLAVSKGLVASYMHNSLAPGLGKIGVLVALESEADDESLAALGRKIAMHVAAANPQYLDSSVVPGADLDRERDVLREQALQSGKSGDVVDKMVEGRLRKFYEETVLPDQVFFGPDTDGKIKVRAVVEAAAKAAGKPIKLTGFVRMQLGEGIDKPTTDLAGEVAATLKH